MSRDGRCEVCPAGQQPEPVTDRQLRWELTGAGATWEVWLQSNPQECVDCAAGRAGADGYCAQCEDGKQPNELSSNCETCDQRNAGIAR